MLLEAKKLLTTCTTIVTSGRHSTSWAAGYRTIAPEAKVPPHVGMSVLLPTYLPTCLGYQSQAAQVTPCTSNRLISSLYYYTSTCLACPYVLWCERRKEPPNATGRRPVDVTSERDWSELGSLTTTTTSSYNPVYVCIYGFIQVGGLARWCNSPPSTGRKQPGSPAAAAAIASARVYFSKAHFRSFGSKNTWAAWGCGLGGHPKKGRREGGERIFVSIGTYLNGKGFVPRNQRRGGWQIEIDRTGGLGDLVVALILLSFACVDDGDNSWL